MRRRSSPSEAGRCRRADARRRPAQGRARLDAHAGSTVGQSVAALLFPAQAAAGAGATVEVLGSVVDLASPERMPVELPPSACKPRSRLLTPMLATHAAFQVPDGHSTRRALSRARRGQGHGVVEANPLMRWAVASDVRLYTVKGAVTAGVWWSLNSYACRHPRRALLLAIVNNALYGFIVGRNYHLGSALPAGR